MSPKPKLVPWPQVRSLTECDKCIAKYVRVPGRLNGTTISQGHVYEAFDGKRLVLVPTGMFILYQNMETFEAYSQDSQGFVNDIGRDVLEAYRLGVVRGQGSVVFAYFSLKLAATLTGAGTLATLAETFSWLHEEKKKGFPTYAKIVGVLAVRSFLKRHAPKLWDIIWWTVLKDVGEQSLSSDNYSVEDFISLLANLCVKSGGGRNFATMLQKILTSLNILATILGTIAKAGVKGIGKEYNERCNALLHRLRQSGAVINFVDHPRIMQELMTIDKHSDEFESIIRSLSIAGSK